MTSTPERTRGANEDASAEVPLAFDGERGRIALFGIPAMFVTPQYFVDLQHQLERLMGKAARGILYRSAESSGEHLVRVVAGRDPQASADAGRLSVLLRVAELLPAAGHGKTDCEVVDLSKGKTLWTFWNAYTELHGASKEPVCHYYAGFVAGVVTAAFGMPTRAVETACRATGAPACVFETTAE